MGDLKTVPHKTLNIPTPDQSSFEQYNYHGDSVRECIVKFQKDYNDILVEVLNRHGIPFSIDRCEEFIGKLHIIEFSHPTINGQIVVIYYEGKEVVRLKKWQEWHSLRGVNRITQHIEEIPTEDTKLELKGNNADQLLVDEGV